MMVPIESFARPSYGDRVVNEVEQCINFYPAKTSAGYKLVSTHGLKLIGTTANNAACRRAYFATTGQMFSVNGNTVYEVSSVGIATSRGTISASSGTVFFADNGTNIILVQAGVNGYTLNLAAGAPTLIVDANFPTLPYGVKFLNGHFIVPQANTSSVYISQLLSTSFTPLQIQDDLGSPDYLNGIEVSGGNLFLIGEKTTKVWYFTQSTDFPFEQISGASFNVGAVYPFSIAQMHGTVYFIGSSSTGRGAVWAVTASGIERISTPSVELSISGQSSAWQGFCYEVEGHPFYQISNTNTWVYDPAEKAWHQKDSNGANHRARVILNGFSTNSEPPFAFDRGDGRIYEIRSNYNSEDGVAMTRTRVFGPIGNGTDRLFHDQIRFVLEADFDSTPSATFTGLTLDWTDDDGRTWSTARTPSVTITATSTGQLITITFNRLGSSAKRYYRIVVLSEACKMIIENAFLKARKGRF